MQVSETAEKIKRMEIRGAGRIARAAAEALRDHALAHAGTDFAAFRHSMAAAAATLTATRPTAVSLPNAVHVVMAGIREEGGVEEAREGIVRRADAFIASSRSAVMEIARIGARHIHDGDTVLTHCNSEAALACIIGAHRDGKRITAFATEVRPRNQGHITIRALNDAGVNTNFIVDSAVRSFIREIDLVLVGADAVTANGAVVNKIGTSMVAHTAKEARVNVVVAAETYKFAPRTIMGEMIAIEERPPREVLPDAIAQQLPRVKVRNPAFDVTPADFIDMIVTEKGAIPPQMAPVIIRDYLGWGIEEFHKDLAINHRNEE